MKYCQYCNHVKKNWYQLYNNLVYVPPNEQGSKKLQALIFNIDKLKSLARKNVNENPIWSWNDSPLVGHHVNMQPDTDKIEVIEGNDDGTTVDSSAKNQTKIMKLKKSIKCNYNKASNIFWRPKVLMGEVVS